MQGRASDLLPTSIRLASDQLQRVGLLIRVTMLAVPRRARLAPCLPGADTAGDLGSHPRPASPRLPAPELKQQEQVVPPPGALRTRPRRWHSRRVKLQRPRGGEFVACAGSCEASAAGGASGEEYEKE